MPIQPSLIKACRKGDRRAQLTLYKECYGMLMGVCYRYKNNQYDATAMMNKGFTKIVQNLKRYKSHIPFEVWARRIMINVAIDEYRTNRKRHELIEYSDQLEQQSQHEPVDFNEADKALELEDLKAMIAELPPVSQTVFNLHFIDGYSHREISELLKIAESTSRWHIAFSRKAILKKIGHLMHTMQNFVL